MKGKVIDKSTGQRIPGVEIILLNEDGDFVENHEGTVSTVTGIKGEFTFDLSPAMYLLFRFPGYDDIIKPYAELVDNSTVKMEDGSGSALTKEEIKAFVKDSSRINTGQWMIGIGIGIFAILIALIIAKKLGWF